MPSDVEVRCLVTYVDPSERSLPLLFPTAKAKSFGDCELVETNVRGHFWGLDFP